MRLLGTEARLDSEETLGRLGRGFLDNGICPSYRGSKYVELTQGRTDRTEMLGSIVTGRALWNDFNLEYCTSGMVI